VEQMPKHLHNQSLSWQKKQQGLILLVESKDNSLMKSLAQMKGAIVDDTIALTQNKAKGELWILLKDEGEELNTIELPSPPQKDGMCIVGDSVIINSGNKLYCPSGL